MRPGFPNHSIQRMRASRLRQVQFGRPCRLALTADADRSAVMRFKNMKAKLFSVTIAALTLTAFAGDIGGIGLVIVDRQTGSEPLRTGSVYPGSPAERAGVTTNGFLISVDGTNVVSMSLNQSASIVRWPVGSFVTLEIADSNMSRTNKFTVKRHKMVISNQKIEFFDQQ
jgi:C-terminal processing protease CtpA/Prc